MATPKKFFRAANFTNDEEHSILDSVEKHKDIIESKRSDSLTWKEKERVWQIVADELNSKSKHPRTANEIKLKYSCLKKAAKKEASKQLQRLRGTGGGPYVPPTNSFILERVVKLVPLAAMGMPSVTDSDFFVVPDNPEHENSEVDEPESFSKGNVSDNSDEEIEMTLTVLESQPGCSGMQPAAVFAEGPDVSEDALQTDWSQYSPAMLRQPKHPALRGLQKSAPNMSYSELQKATEGILQSKGSTSNTSRRRPKLQERETISSASTAKYSALAVAKTELAKMQKDLLVQENTAREARLAEEHELCMTIRKAELKLKNIQIKNEEAALKIKLLKLQSIQGHQFADQSESE